MCQVGLTHGSDNLNPRFVKQIRLDYRFEAIQRLRFVVLDIDDIKGPINKQDLIGEMVFQTSIRTPLEMLHELS